MGLFLSNGTRRTKAGVDKTAVPDPQLVTLNEDLYETVPWGAGDSSPEGSIKKLWRKAGSVVLQSEIDAKYPAATATAISPATGLAAGGEAITITGTDLDGVTDITFGGTAATAVEVVSSTSITCVAPAHAAGAVTVVLTDDSGAVTKAAFYTYT